MQDRIWSSDARAFVSYTAELRWPALLGGETETIGPVASSREIRRRVSAIVGGYPGQYGPSVRIVRHEDRELESLQASEDGMTVSMARVVA